MQGEKDWEKYEIARKLKSCVDDIRNQYMQDLKSKHMGTRQRAVALYFIDKVCLEPLVKRKHQSKDAAIGTATFTPILKIHCGWFHRLSLVISEHVGNQCNAS